MTARPAADGRGVDPRGPGLLVGTLSLARRS